MNCPICNKDKGISKLINGAFYHKCECGTIYTGKISHLIKTENESSIDRNTNQLNQIRLNRALKVNPNAKTILDFGCGYGLFVSFLRFNNYTADGIDNGTNLRLEDLKDNQYDIIFMIEVIEHLFDPKNVLLQLCNALTRTGVLYIETTFSDQIDDFTNSSYIDPSIGHATILSKKALQSILPKSFKCEWVNDNVILVKKLN